MTNDEMKEQQHKKLKELHAKVKEVAYERPCDSENDEEEYIWDTIELLNALMEDFFRN